MSSTNFPSAGTVSKPSPNSKKTFYKTSSPFEQQIGYYRAVRHGQHIFVSGTTAVDPGSPPSAPEVLYPGDAAKQMRVALHDCIRAVESVGGKGAESVVRVRMFVSRHEDCAAVGEVFREVMGGRGEIGAAATMIVVQNGFIDKNMMVEVEVDAIADDDS